MQLSVEKLILMIYIKQELLRALRPSLLDSGYTEEEVEILFKRATEEINDASLQLYLLWCTAWAKKKLL